MSLKTPAESLVGCLVREHNGSNHWGLVSFLYYIYGISLHWRWAAQERASLCGAWMFCVHFLQVASPITKVCPKREILFCWSHEQPNKDRFWFTSRDTHHLWFCVTQRHFSSGSVSANVICISLPSSLKYPWAVEESPAAPAKHSPFFGQVSSHLNVNAFTSYHTLCNSVPEIWLSLVSLHW